MTKSKVKELLHYLLSRGDKEVSITGSSSKEQKISTVMSQVSE